MDDDRDRLSAVDEDSATVAGSPDPRAAPTADIGGTPASEIDLSGVPRLRRGDVFAGRYRIVSHLGRGGFSQVFRGEDVESGRAVALKFLAARESGANLVSRMRRELRLARDLRHPNIVQVFDLLEAGETYCLVMEYIEGRTLKSRVVDEGALPLPEALRILVDIASALAAVHAGGIVHRDLKPQNVMLTEEGEVKLLDFGLAKTPDSTGLTATGTILGTPDYMSPEQVDGKPADTRSDVYSLGVIAFELLAGSPPFEGDTPISVALQHVRSRVPDPARSRPGLPSAVSRTVLHMTEPSRERRPGSAQELLLPLERLLKSDSVEGGGTPRGRTRRRVAVALAAAVVAVAVGLALGLPLLRSGGQAAAGPRDVFADGMVEVEVVAREIEDAREVAGMERFLGYVADAVAERLETPEIEIVAPGAGAEHRIELDLDAEIGPDGREFRIAGRVLEIDTDSEWLRLPRQPLESLDVVAIEQVSTRFAEVYLQAVESQLEAGG